MDMTPEVANELAEKYVGREWENPKLPMSEHFASREAAIESMAESYLQPGAPWVRVVE